MKVLCELHILNPSLGAISRTQPSRGAFLTAAGKAAYGLRYCRYIIRKDNGRGHDVHQTQAQAQAQAQVEGRAPHSYVGM